VVATASEKLMADAVIVVYTGTNARGRTWTKWHYLGNEHAVLGALGTCYDDLAGEADDEEE
jgi:hypothetical protein